MYFPEWSDLGNISDETRLTWENELSLREKWRRYFDGRVFLDRVPLEAGSDDEAPLLYPVGINLVKMLCLAQADTLFGEWEDQVFRFEVRQEDVVDEPSRQAIDILSRIMAASDANSLFWELDVDRQIYGGGAAQVSVSLASPGHVKWSRVPLQGFFPVWNPDDPNELLEVYTVTEMTAEQARARYGILTSKQTLQRVMHWTTERYENKIDGRRIDAYSGVNPWGFVPFVYAPRLRTSVWWGDSLADEIIPVQDELNMRIADIGEALNYNAHPTRWGLNLPRGFNVKNFPIGPNAMWDLGRVIGQSPAPQVGLLEAKNPVPQGAFDYLKFIYDWGRTSSFTPPIVFGEDNGGGQRSGATLEIRMLPLLRAIHRSRAYLGEAVLRMAWMTGKILAQKRFSDVPSRAVSALLSGNLVVRFEEVLPRDHQAVVDEVVKLLSTTPPGISLETAQKILGRGAGEPERIKQMIADKAFYPDGFNKSRSVDAERGHKPEPSNDVKEGMQGKQTPQSRKES